MTGNDFIAWLLRSPFHTVLSSTTLLITVTGRKTGKAYTTPVTYLRQKSTLWIMSSRDRSWWKNLQGGARVTILIRRQSIHAFATLLTDPPAVEERLAEYLLVHPRAATQLGIPLLSGVPDPFALARAAKQRLFIRVILPA